MVGTPRSAWLALVLGLAASVAQGQELPSGAPPPMAPAATERGPLAAAPSACATRGFVLLEADGSLEAEFVRQVGKELATELSGRGLGLCMAGQGPRESAAAVVTLRAEPGTLSIALDDRTTRKRVARDMELSRLPQDGRALALAIAVDELLRASWAELTMLAHPPQEPARAPATAAPAVPPSTRRRKLRSQLLAVVAHTHSAARYDALAVLGAFELRSWRHAWLALGLGATGVLPVSSPLGRAAALGLSSSWTMGACMDAGSRVQLCAGPRLGADWLSFRGRARAQAQGYRAAGWLLQLSGVGALSVSLARSLVLSAQLGLGAPLHALRVREGDRTVVGATGLLLSSQLGLGVRL